MRNDAQLTGAAVAGKAGYATVLRASPLLNGEAPTVCISDLEPARKFQIVREWMNDY